jgi:hypothetical protein
MRLVRVEESLVEKGVGLYSAQGKRRKKGADLFKARKLTSICGVK